MTHKQILMTATAAIMIAAMGIFAGCKKDNEENLAKLVTGIYIGNITLEEDLVGENNQVVVKYHSPKQVVFSIEGETFKVPQMGNIEAEIKAECVAKVTKIENGHNAEGKTEASLMVSGITLKLPTKINATFIDNDLDMNIAVELPAMMGGENIVVRFKGLKILED